MRRKKPRQSRTVFLEQLYDVFECFRENKKKKKRFPIFHFLGWEGGERLSADGTYIDWFGVIIVSFDRNPYQIYFSRTSEKNTFLNQYNNPDF